jgi:methionyl-tRNA formyltransferase
VHELAEQAGIEVFTPTSLRDSAEQERFKALQLDLCVVAAYGLLLPEPILQAPKRGCVNLHGSLLPRWRGAAPVQRAILAGDTQSGVCLMGMEKGLDTGPVFARVEVPITDTTTSASLMMELAEAGASLLDAKPAGLGRGSACRRLPQPTEGVCYAEKLSKDESQINWTQTAAQIDRQVRAFTPWPAAQFVLLDEVLKVRQAQAVPSPNPTAAAGTVLDEQFTVACGEGTALRLLSVQRAGRPATSGAECLRGLQHMADLTALIAS